VVRGGKLGPARGWTRRHAAGSWGFVSPDARNRPFRIHAYELESINDFLKVFELRISIEAEAAGFAAELMSVFVFVRLLACSESRVSFSKRFPAS
jgi:hypothetical protein